MYIAIYVNSHLIRAISNVHVNAEWFCKHKRGDVAFIPLKHTIRSSLSRPDQKIRAFILLAIAPCESIAVWPRETTIRSSSVSYECIPRCIVSYWLYQALHSDLTTN